MSDSETASTARLREATTIAKIALSVAGFAALAIVAASLVLRFADTERARDLRTWQTRLGIIADSRAAAVEAWLARQYRELRELAENTSLQLYMTELSVSGAGAGTARSGRLTQSLAESGYLRNLLTVVAGRAGYLVSQNGPRVAANVNRVGLAGLALVDNDGRVLVATMGMPPLAGRLGELLAEARDGEPALADMYPGAGGSPTMAFSVPVFAVQDTRTRQIGRIPGVRPVADALFPLLKQPGVTWRNGRAILVRQVGPVVEYLSPTGKDGPALKRTMAFDTAGLAASFAVRKPGGFAIRRDYRDREVLVTGRRINLAPWSLVYEIGRDEALGESDARISRLMAISALIIALVAALVLAAWRHGTSRRASAAASRHQRLAVKFETQSQFLRLVTDAQPSPMFIVDGEGTYRFANRAAALHAGIDDSDMVGKSMAAVIGPAEAERYERFNRDAMESGTVQTQIHRAGSNGDLRVMQAEHIPFKDAADLPPGVMVVEEDITKAVTEQERRERTLQQLIETLLTIVDRRDPHAADHSARVAVVARDIAVEMGLDEHQAACAETAGRLMNLGKILVPSELLSRAGTLDAGEVDKVRESIQMSAELLSGIEFEGPVVETLHQIQERWDGSGRPMGLKGRESLVTARVVAVANAFVAMTSPRAYRSGVSADAATDQLMTQIGTAFERRVVVALVNLLDSRGVSAQWANPDRPAPIH